ncbi:hypothetical protein Cgig2_017902 [Carnegiea gigantea]|uniref:Aminotransferase-like plant mobile domain-containing protein n=1 Tax=Carnegiea gigantea TaxID=171969 RepID=A0A9Q1QDC6_9CARY|nr:hypothetical protein Cgig2_017902 [Carnegiea gigantea]
MVISGVLFPRTPYGATWGMLHYTENIEQMGQYNWAEAVWRVVVETIEDTQKKLCAGPLSDVQLNGFSLLIQVWFYEHTTRFANQDKRRFPRIASWARVDHGGAYACLASMDMYVQVIPVLYPRDDEIVHPTVRDFTGTDKFGYYVDDGEGWLSVDERLRRARDAYRSEKVAHESTKNELQMLREQVANLEGRLVTNRKGEGDGQDVSSGTAVGAEEGVGGDGGPTPGDISIAAGVMDTVRGVGQQPVSRNERAVYRVPGGVDRNEEVGRDLGREDGDSGMGLSGSGVDDREAVHVSAADACTPGVSVKHGSDRASNIVTRMKRKPQMRKASALRGSPYSDPLRGRRGTKTAHRRERSTAAGTVDPVNGHGKNVVRTAAVVPNQEVKETEVELGSRAVHDGEESMDFFSEEVRMKTSDISDAVVAYLTHPLSPDEVQLSADVRDECKGLEDGEW